MTWSTVLTVVVAGRVFSQDANWCEERGRDVRGSRRGGDVVEGQLDPPADAFRPA